MLCYVLLLPLNNWIVGIGRCILVCCNVSMYVSAKVFCADPLIQVLDASDALSSSNLLSCALHPWWVRFDHFRFNK